MKTHDDICKILVVLLALTASALLSCKPATEPERPEIQASPVSESEAVAAAGPPPLVVDTNAPLLLDEPIEGQASAGATTQAAAENTACFVCHANYRTESLASHHAEADVSCVNCHGQSSAHRNDENNITPPETLYSADKIKPFCQSCHKTHDIPPEEVVARWAERGLHRSAPSAIVCTDCHGEHRMKVRTVIWDKRTGRLLRTNRGD